MLDNLPTSVDLRKYVPMIRSQHLSGSCSAQACILAAEILLKKANRFVSLSALFVYYMTRKNQGRLGQHGSPICETLKAMEQYGVPPESLWPYFVPNENTHPTLISCNAASNTKLRTYEYIKHSALDEYNQKIKSYLATGLPVIVGISTGRKFWNLRGPLDQQGYVPVNNMDNRRSTGHAIVIVGYDDSLNGGAFIVANSFGPRWGFQGYGSIPYMCSVDIGEAWVITDFAGTGL